MRTHTPASGYDNGKAINYNEALSMLQGGVNDPNAVGIRWDMTSREHVLMYAGSDGTEHTATYPTLQFIQVIAVFLWDMTDTTPRHSVNFILWRELRSP